MISPKDPDPSRSKPEVENGLISVSKTSRGPGWALIVLRETGESPVLCWGSEEKHLGSLRYWDGMSNTLMSPPLIIKPTNATQTTCAVTRVTHGELNLTTALAGTSIPHTFPGCLRYLLCSAQMGSGEHTYTSTSQTTGTDISPLITHPFPINNAPGLFPSVKLGFVCSRTQGNPGVELC